uniref:RecQ-mediated genome instability protein 2 n=1 Tax=Chelonoidis abingdonii TaxID=106734 RepID=A0A8C0JAR0_CHEAB
MAGEPRSPPLKVLAAQLRQCRRAAVGPGCGAREAGGARWPGARGGSARLQDESGPFTVLGVSGPQGGKYVMVMGLVHSCSPEPILQAVKMTDLSDNPIHRSMWSFEVEDLHRNIS